MLHKRSAAKLIPCVFCELCISKVLEQMAVTRHMLLYAPSGLDTHKVEGRHVPAVHSSESPASIEPELRPWHCAQDARCVCCVSRQTGPLHHGR